MSKRAASGPPLPVEDNSTPLAKKPRTSSPELSIHQILQLSESGLKASNKETLVRHVLALQSAWGTFQAQNVNVAASSSQPAVAAGMDDAKVKQMASKAAEMMYSGIKKQMKWQ